MLFNSLEYAIFLVAVFLIYWGLFRLGGLRIGFLIVASYVFYAASNPWFLSLLVASTLTDYFVGLGMHRATIEGARRRKKLLLVVSLAMNLGLLATFKYANFFYESFVDVGNSLGGDLTFTKLDIFLPAGISFYTFQTMSYTIDLYRGRCAPERNLGRFALFVGFFPQLVAGPIVRAVDFLPQTAEIPYVTRGQVSRAFWLISIGLFKKALADYVGINAVDPFFYEDKFGGGVGEVQPGTLSMLVALYAYTMQIYLDFSAYSDLAIGSALLFGYRLPDNFDRPYKAVSIQDFWRRWHKTLGSWLRDYLYYPLGGSKGSQWATYRNLFITFVLIGLWHGAAWTFVVYGCLHATAMCVHRFFRVTVAKRQKPQYGLWGAVWRIFVTLNFVVFARIFFRSKDFEQAGDVFARLGELSFAGDFDLYAHPDGGGGGYDLTVLSVLIGCYIVHWTPRRWIFSIGASYERLPFAAKGAILCVVALVGMNLVEGKVPFKYFQF
jgi:alginate O-acetyltransferase complex protein AlgI